MPPSSPTTAGREFSLRISSRRRELGLKAAAVAQQLGFSRVYLSAIENNRASLSRSRLPDLFDVLGFDQEEAEELTVLLKASREPGWWDPYAKILPASFVEFIGLEHGAKRVQIFESRVMTGLLQTREYATVVVDSAPDVSPTKARQLVDVRLHRQRRLAGPDPLAVELVLSEAVLMQQFGGPDILRSQLQRLLEGVDLGLVKLRVQPFHITPLGMTMSSTVVILEFDSVHQPRVVWMEGSDLSVELVEARAEVEMIMVSYERLLVSCLDEVESLDLVRRRLVELDKELIQ